MKFDIVRAWKDESYRQSLSEEELAMLPDSPVGRFELTEAELEVVHGAGSDKAAAAPATFFGVIQICIQSAIIAICHNLTAAPGKSD